FRFGLPATASGGCVLSACCAAAPAASSAEATAGNSPLIEFPSGAPSLVELVVWSIFSCTVEFLLHGVGPVKLAADRRDRRHAAQALGVLRSPSKMGSDPNFRGDCSTPGRSPMLGARGTRCAS